MTTPALREYTVTFRVKYSELWCADECDWIEHSENVLAFDEGKAKREVRERLKSARRIIVGRHVSTQLTRR